MTPIEALQLAMREDREVVTIDVHGNALRALVVAVDADGVVLLPTAAEPTSPIPLTAIDRVRVLDIAPSLARRMLLEARERRRRSRR